MASMHALLRRLAEVTPGELPVLSVYLDMRFHATGETPTPRPGLRTLTDRLDEIEKTFLPRGAALDSIRADTARITDYLARDFAPDVHGLAIFACAGRELFEAHEASLPFDTTVAIGPQPDLFQLARLLDEQETAVVALFETTTARLFVTRHGWLDAVGGPDHGTELDGARDVSGWVQEHFQRHTNAVRSLFAGEVADDIDRLVERTGATRVILAGDEIAIPHLREALSKRVTGLLRDEVVQIDIRAPQREIKEQIDTILAAAEVEDAQSTADRLIDAVRGDRLGVAGLGGTRAALERGQVDTLLLDPTSVIDETRGELVRLAVTTGGHVEVVEGYEPFRHLGGIGALLRYRH